MSVSQSRVILILVLAIAGLWLGYSAAKILAPGLLAEEQTISSPRRRLPLESKTTGQMMDEEPVSGFMSLQFEPERAVVGQTVTARLVIDTQGEDINGFDILLRFDPQFWSVEAGQVLLPQENLFSNYPVNSVAISEGRGEINLSGLTEPGAVFNGRAEVGSLRLTPKVSGNLSLEWIYEGIGLGNDSNLAESGSGRDILSRVDMGELEVR